MPATNNWRKEFSDWYYSYNDGEERPNAMAIADWFASHVLGGEGEMKKQNDEWKEECDRLAKLVEYWQGEYYKLNPPHKNPKIDNL